MYNKLRFVLYMICTHDLFELLVTLIVIGNGITMSLVGNILSESQMQVVESVNATFTIFFLVEFLIKVIGLGLASYYSDSMNILDFLIVLFGMVDYELSNYISNIAIGLDNNGKVQLRKKFNILNIVKIFRSLRLLKILKKLKTMKKILNGVMETIGNVMYLLALIAMFILIYMLVGMALMSEDNNFKTLISAFFLVFDIMTVENWNNYLYSFY